MTCLKLKQEKLENDSSYKKTPKLLFDNNREEGEIEEDDINGECYGEGYGEDESKKKQ